jgi:hypothetical protein
MSDFPKFDEAYLRMMLPENPDQFDMLAAKANFGIYRHDLWHGTGRRFAELIVRECAEQSMSIGRYNTPSGITPDLAIAISVGLKKHFGVEDVGS